MHSRIRAGNNRADQHAEHQRVAARRSSALGVAVRLRGWSLTEFRHLDVGSATGPCALCRQQHHRYGPFGTPLCVRCAA